MLIGAALCLAACPVEPDLETVVKSENPPEPKPIEQPVDFYVELTGSDSAGDGSPEKPWRTVAFAASRVGGGWGHSIRIGSGVFHETEQIVLRPKVNLLGAGAENTTLTSSTMVSLSAESKEGFLIRASSNAPQSEVLANPTAVPDGSQEIGGFSLDGRDKSFNGLWVERRNNVTIRDINFLNCHSMGARVFEQLGKDAAYLKGIVIRDCSFKNCARDFNAGGSGYDPGDFSTGSLNIGGLDGALIENITVDCDYGYGIKFNRDGYFKNTTIRNCAIRVPESDPMWGEDIALELWNLGPGNKVHNISCNTWISIVNHPNKFAAPVGTENLEIHSVRIVDEDGFSAKEGMEIGTPGVEIHNCYIENKGFGFAVWDQGKGNIVIRHNVFRNLSYQGAGWNGGAGVLIANSRDWDFNSIKIHHNIFAGAANGVFIKSESTKAVRNIDIANNIFLDVAPSGTVLKISADGAGSLMNVEVVGLVSNLTNNNASLMVGKSNGGWLNSSGNLTNADPLFSPNGDDPLVDWYVPGSESPAIGAGADRGYPYVGAPDIGRYEQ